MNFLEKDLEEIIYTTDVELLKERGLTIAGGMLAKRQLRIGNYGVADLVTLDRYLDQVFINGVVKDVFKPIITVYELKKDNVNVSTFLQAVRYAKGIMRYLDKRDSNHEYKIKICLIGSSLDLNSSFSYLVDLLPPLELCDIEFLSVFTYKYDIDGLSFNEESGYKLIEEGF